ncbi:MAG: hypothetical protein ACK4MD_06185 [Demequina sp.]
MEMSEKWQRARLIPVVGTASGREREQRATSALLAVLSIVRPFSIELLSPLGASRAARATVDAYVEPPFKAVTGRDVRPDGLIRVRYGNQQPWTALVEVKTGTNELTLEQINAYIECAREHKYDHVITISNQIAPSEGVHPTESLKIRKDAKVKVSHFSWTRVAAISARVRDRTGIDDVEQDWILAELIRYLEHQSSGALEFDDMGPEWTSVKDGARAAALRRTDPAVLDIARRWDQLLTFAALKLGIQIGEEVEEVMPRAHRDDAAVRTKQFARDLSETGVLTGSLRVRNSVGDIDVAADLRARRLAIGTTVRAPHDKKARGSVSWLVKQLSESPPALEVEAIAKNHSTGPTAVLGALRDDPTDFYALLDDDVAKLRITWRTDLGTARRGGRGAGFVDSVLSSLLNYYRTTHQRIVAYPSRAPQVTEKGGATADVELGSQED